MDTLEKGLRLVGDEFRSIRLEVDGVAAAVSIAFCVHAVSDWQIRSLLADGPCNSNSPSVQAVNSLQMAGPPSTPPWLMNCERLHSASENSRHTLSLVAVGGVTSISSWLHIVKSPHSRSSILSPLITFTGVSCRRHTC